MKRHPIARLGMGLQYLGSEIGRLSNLGALHSAPEILVATQGRPAHAALVLGRSRSTNPNSGRADNDKSSLSRWGWVQGGCG